MTNSTESNSSIKKSREILNGDVPSTLSTTDWRLYPLVSSKVPPKNISSLLIFATSHPSTYLKLKEILTAVNVPDCFISLTDK